MAKIITFLITKEDGQYTRSFTSISNSYYKIADGLIKLKRLI